MVVEAVRVVFEVDEELFQVRVEGAHTVVLPEATVRNVADVVTLTFRATRSLRVACDGGSATTRLW